MKALCWYGTQDVRVDTVPDPEIRHPRDAIIKITSTAICGSDLHLYDGFMPTMEKGDVLGHEPMGEVVEVGSDVKKLKKGDRVVVPFTISCGTCWFCQRKLFSLCDTSNPNAEVARKAMGQSPAGLFGYSHMLGGYPGGQAEYLRVPFADVGPIKIPDGLPDEKVVVPLRHLPDRLHGRRERRDRAGRHGRRLGLRAGRAVRHPERLDARRRPGDRHRPGAGTAADGRGARQGRDDQLRGGGRLRPPDGDDQGARAGPLHRRGRGRGARRRAASTRCSTRPRRPVGSATDRPHVLREAIMCCRKGGTVSVPGVYIGFLDKIPFGAAMNKGLDLEDGTDARAALPSPAPEEDRGRRDRPVVRHHAPARSRRRARGLQDLPRQEGRLHQGRAETCCVSRYMRARLKRNTREPL